jgi:hypothetical protein
VGTALLLYLLYTGTALGLCAWAAWTALQRVEEHRPAHRALTLLAAVLLPPAIGAATLAGPLERPELQLALLAVPLLTLVAEVSAGMTLAGQGLFRRLLHVPIAAWNGTLIVVHLLRAALELAGADLSTELTALTAAHARLQQHVGAYDALIAPYWFHLPLMIPLWLRYGVMHTLALFVTSLIATAMLTLLALEVPHALDKVDSYRASERQTVVIRSDLSIGISIPVDDARRATWLPTITTEADWRARADLLDALAPDVVGVTVDPDTLGDAAAMQRLRELRDELARGGRRLVVTARPDARFADLPAADLDELADSLTALHRIVATTLEPDLLVLYSGPYSELSRMIVTPVTIDQWIERLQHDDAALAQAAPEVQTAVTVRSRAAHAEELYRRLASPKGPVDAVALGLSPERMTLDEVQSALATWSGWTTRIPGEREVWVLETGAAPAVVGGEFGQWALMREVLKFATQTPRARGVVFDALIDRPDAARGIVAAFGRPRLAFRRLADELSHRRPLRAPLPTPSDEQPQPSPR